MEERERGREREGEKERELGVERKIWQKQMDISYHSVHVSPFHRDLLCGITTETLGIQTKCCSDYRRHGHVYVFIIVNG